MDSTKIGKGIFIMIGIILTAFQAGTNIWPVAIITAILTGCSYYVSNLWIISTSGQGEWNLQDFAKGAILAVSGALVNSVINFFYGNNFQWKLFGLAALGAFVTYISSTFFTGNKK